MLFESYEEALRSGALPPGILPPCGREPSSLIAVDRAILSIPDQEQGVVATPDEMRLFALECLRWAEQADDQSQFDLMLQCARSWMSIASAVEHSVRAGGISAHGLQVQSEVTSPPLRSCAPGNCEQL
jgi:hypothetical protein